jgi:type II secretory pathway pseudopilin PulG
MKRSLSFARHDSFVIRGSPAFTLVELIVVVTIIFILSGLVFTAAGYIQKKAGRSRAEAEMIALASAIEAYKNDNGNYPRDTSNQSSTDKLEANAIAAGDPKDPLYLAASQFLYGQLSGDYDPNASGNGSTNYNYLIDTDTEKSNRVYFNFPPSMLSVSVINTKGKGPTAPKGGPPPPPPDEDATYRVNFICDPFGYPYGYSTAGQDVNGKDYNNRTYDLWTTGGTVCKDASEGCMAQGGTIVDKSQWIKNW